MFCYEHFYFLNRFPIKIRSKIDHGLFRIIVMSLTCARIKANPFVCQREQTLIFYQLTFITYFFSVCQTLRYLSFIINKMTIPHEWRVKSVNSQRESKKIVSRERSSSETIFLLFRGELTDFTRHELQYCFYSQLIEYKCQIY